MMLKNSIAFLLLMCAVPAFSQQATMVEVATGGVDRTINVTIGGKPFTTFLFTDTLEKPVLFPIIAPNGATITRGFPLATRPGDPTDHPHHVGLWLTFENVNGLDFWNNSYAIPPDKKQHYGWIKTTRITGMSSGQQGSLSYNANWTNEANAVLLKEATKYLFSGNSSQRIIDRITTLTADTTVLFKDAKDGLLGLRVAHELQIPSNDDQEYVDDKGNVTKVKGGADAVAGGNYLTSDGKTGNDAWSTRAKWCKMFGKMQGDSVSVTIIDHPANINYPAYWHARGYGLFAVNPLGEHIFTGGKTEKNLQLKKGESVTFRYRIVVHSGANTPSPQQINQLAQAFATIQ